MADVWKITQSDAREKAIKFAEENRLDQNRVIDHFERARQADWAFYIPNNLSPPLPLLMKHFDGEKALDLLEKEDLEALYHLEREYKFVLDFQMLYTLDELAELCEIYVAYLERNREHLILTGYPKTSFSKSLWFDNFLSRLYFVKVQWFNPLWKERFFLRNKIQFGESPPYSIKKDYDKFGDLINTYYWFREVACFLVTGRYGFPYVGFMKEGPQENVTFCTYEEAALIGLGEKPGAWDDFMGILHDYVVASREPILDLKIDILSWLSKTINQRDIMDLWQHCLHIITNKISASTVHSLIKEDKKYALVGVEPNSCYRDNDQNESWIYRNGTLSDLITFIGYIEKELKIGTMYKTKEKLLKLPTGRVPESYIDSVGQPWRKEFDEILREFYNIRRRERAFWDEYQHRVNKSFGRHYYECTLANPKHGYVTYIQAPEESEGTYLLKTGQQPTQLSSPIESGESPSTFKTTENISSFPSPEGLRWEEVTISFVSNDSIRVQARNLSQRYTFAEIGFKDGRKGDLPDTIWITFRDLFAKFEGEISPSTKINRTEQAMLKPRVSLIRRRLKSLMSIDDDPFYPYRTVGAYKTKFILQDLRQGTGYPER